MANFKIKATRKVMMAYIYDVEADSKEEALEKYNNEPIGSIDKVNVFVTPEMEETTTVYLESDYKYDTNSKDDEVKV